MTHTRVLLVEDSHTVRGHLRDILSSDPELDICGEAEDGKQAIEACRRLRPDVISLDMMLPVMTGLAVTEYLMAYCPTPILIVSASTNRGEVFRTYDALAAGAVDVIEKPLGGEPDGEWEARYVRTLKLVSRIKVITHPRARLGAAATHSHQPSGAGPSQSREGYRVVVLGASTGGPAAIMAILRTLPPSLAVPVLIVLHMNEPFAVALADWLDGQTPHRVAYARDGESVVGTIGRVVLAPPGRHLVVRAGTLRLTDDAPRHFCRPSVDVLFESIAAEYASRAIGCLLTGMGRDGAAGLLGMRRAGGYTIAQDEATSVVYGMPREAAMLGAAFRILPLGEIAVAVAEAVAHAPKEVS